MDQNVEIIVLERMNPSYGKTAGGYEVLITGWFYSAATVVWNDQFIVPKVSTPNSIRFVVPPGSGDVSCYVSIPPHRSRVVIFTYTNTRFSKINFSALIVGINRYRGVLPPLRYAAADGVSLGSTVMSMQGHAEIVLNEKATKGNIFSKLPELIKNCKEKNEKAVFYFAGHSRLVDGSLKLCVYSDTMSHEEVDISDVIEYFAAESNGLLILDSCFAGSLVDENKFMGTDEITEAFKPNTSDTSVYLIVPTEKELVKDGFFTPLLIAMWRNINQGIHKPSSCLQAARHKR